MNAADSQRLLQHIRRLAGDPPNTPSDGELLRRYLTSCDQAAFTALVRRHGPMVLSVCQAVLTMATATTAATALARGFLRSLLPLKLAMLSALLLSMSVGIGGMALRSPSEPPSGSGESNRSLTVAARNEAEPREAVDAHGDPLPDGAVARLGTIRFNHGDGLNALYFTSDGKTILSEGNGSIRFWDADNGKELDRIGTDKASFFYNQTELLVDGKTLLTLSKGREGDVVRIWDLARKKEIRTWKLPLKRMDVSALYQNALSPDGKLAVLHVETPAQVQVFDLTTRKDLYQLAKGEKEFLAVAFAGNDRLVSADKKQRIEVWEARTGKRLRQFAHDVPIRYLLTAPDGRCLAGLQQRPAPYGRRVEQDIVYLWDINTGKIKQTLRAKPKHWFMNVRFSPEGKTLLTSSRRPDEADEVVLWDRETGQRLLKFDAAYSAEIMAISPDGSRLAAGFRLGKFELWDLKTGLRLTSEDGRRARAFAVSFTPTGDRATLIGPDSISSWDAASGRRLHSFDLPRLNELRDISSDGRYAATFRVEGEKFPIGGSFQIVEIWDIATGKCLHALRFPGGFPHIDSMAFAPDSSLLATWHPGKQALVRFWDVGSGKQVRSFEEKTAFAGKNAEWPGRMSFTADGKTLFVAGKHVAAYQVASGKELFSWRLKPLPNTSGIRTRAAPTSEDDQIGWRSLAVSPDGCRIAAVLWDVGFSYQHQENRLALYDARGGRRLRRWNDSGLYTPACDEPLLFSADGQLLASSDGHAVHLWETATGKYIHTFKGHQGAIAALAFSRDDRRLASASWDSTVLIWDISGQRDKPVALTEAKLKQCWNDLAGEDAGRAHRAVWTLSRAPHESLPFLKARLHPVKPVRREQLDRWIQDLDAGAFDVRQKAEAELEKLGELAEPALRRALENKPALEQRRRIEPMLAKLEAAISSGDALRSWRAVRVLEHIDTAEARRLLAGLAKGADGATLTRAAQAAPTRRNRRAP